MKKLILLLIAILLPLKVYSYEVNVHRSIAGYAMDSSNIKQYLLNNLGIRLNEDIFKADIFQSKSAREWIKAGSDWEDSNFDQSWLNHFYDPTTGMGLNSSGTTWGQPSLVWGKYYSVNLWNWHVTRDAFYNALTATGRGSRENYYAKLFEGLGHVIHLVHDLAVPAHVRNDPHGAPIVQYDMYEAYTKKVLPERV